ncbi:MAG: MoxR family ATPase [Clostridiales bacterium]|nr:MoxR family ATPase [Eubacteriales bacterium]MDH7567606.1 MoxR family ATPase [Clostridiales bacterium]
MDVSGSDVKNVMDTVAKIENEIAKQMVGQRELIRQVVICILAGGNVLLEGVPGLGKTRLVKTLGKVLGLSFSRIQFTPDLMPADVVGTNIIVRSGGEEGMFKFQPGPIFSHIVLADEINRATPKTQSALLEAMQEQTVTVGGTTYKMPRPFFVLATQNPIEMEGTYPLPEAQLDRFLFKLDVPFPSLEELTDIVTMTAGNREEELQKVSSGEEIMIMRNIAREIPVAKPVLEFAMRLVLATHPESEFAPPVTKKYVRFGSSPRGAQAVIAAARLRAVLDGRYNVAFEDVKYAAYPALRHRVFLNFEGQSEGITADSLIGEIISALG